MSIPVTAVFAVLLAGTAMAQTAAPIADGGGQNSGNGSQSMTTSQGASPARAKGGSPSRQPAMSNAQGTATGDSSTRRRNTRRGKAAPVANGNVEFIGSDGSNARATIDTPLLSIASIGNGLGIRSGTPIHVLLKQSVDSGHARNGDMLDATLAQPLAGLPAGTPVKITVVQASPAGALLSFGEISLQVVSVGTHAVLSDTISAQGQEGKKEQADSAPARGTEATFPAGQEIVLPAA